MNCGEVKHTSHATRAIRETKVAWNREAIKTGQHAFMTHFHTLTHQHTMGSRFRVRWFRLWWVDNYKFMKDLPLPPPHPKKKKRKMVTKRSIPVCSQMRHFLILVFVCFKDMSLHVQEYSEVQDLHACLHASTLRTWPLDHLQLHIT